MAAEVVLAPGNYGAATRQTARAILSNLPAEVNVARFVRSVDRQNRIERRFRLNRQKKVVLANFEYRRLPDGTIQRREIGGDTAGLAATDGDESTRRDRIRDRIRALVGAGASAKNLKKKITKKRQVQKCRKRPRKCRRLLGL